MRKQRFSFVQLLGMLFILASCVPQPSATSTSTPEPPSIPTAVAATVEPSSTPSATNTVAPTLEPTLPSVLTLPDPAGTTWTVVKNGLQRPVNLANAADGSSRLFILEQQGVVRVLLNNEILAAPFLDIQDRVGRNGNEQGLLGIAFHPDFKNNGFFFVDYTDLNGNTVISRFNAALNEPPASQTADPASEQILLQIGQPYSNHNGGQIVFGPDGMLWIGMGDGGGKGDPNGNGQSLQTLLGKILRIDVDHGSPYAIPADNPFASGGGQPEIWAYGLRNPWGLSFDALAGDLYIADVGQSNWEEVNFLLVNFSAAPANFGWNLLEGAHPYKNGGQTTPENYIAPVFEYGHGPECSITGGAVYRGKLLPEFYGVYLFGDYCSGAIWGMVRSDGQNWQAEKLFQTSAKISSFGVDEVGELYFVDLSGTLYRLETK